MKSYVILLLFITAVMAGLYQYAPNSITAEVDSPADVVVAANLQKLDDSTAKERILDEIVAYGQTATIEKYSHQTLILAQQLTNYRLTVDEATIAAYNVCTARKTAERILVDQSLIKSDRLPTIQVLEYLLTIADTKLAATDMRSIITDSQNYLARLYKQEAIENRNLNDAHKASFWAQKAGMEKLANHYEKKIKDAIE